MDLLLGAWLPDYKTRILNRRVSTATRINLLAAARLIPNEYIRSLECILRVRNDFAHELAVKTFDALPQNTRNKLRATRDAYKFLKTDDWEERKGASRKRFRDIVTITLEVLDGYTSTTTIFSRWMRSKKTQEMFLQWAGDRHLALDRARSRRQKS